VESSVYGSIKPLRRAAIGKKRARDGRGAREVSFGHLGRQEAHERVEVGALLSRIVDLHAVTVFQEPAALRAKIEEIAALYLAAGIDPKTSAMVIVMQRCHQRDLSGHLLEKGNFEHLRLPAEFEEPRCVTSIGWTDPRTQPGELLWEEQFGAKEIADLKISLGSYAAAGQLQQRPSPAGGGIFKRAMQSSVRRICITSFIRAPVVVKRSIAIKPSVAVA